MKKKLSVLTLASCFAALIVTSCTKKEEAAQQSNKILLGEFASLTGEVANFGQSTDKGIQLAMEQFNAAGGLNGKKIEIKVYDDQSKPEEASNTAMKLITQDNVVALIGEIASSLSLVAADIAMRHKVPMLSPGSTNPDVTKKGEYIFRICFIDPFQGEVMAKFASENLHAKTAAIFRDVKQDYSVGLADFFKKSFEARGGKILIDTAYQSKDSDFKAQLTEIKAKKPDVVFVPGYYNDVGLIAQQARSVGITQPLLGGDGWDSQDLVKVGGAALDGTYYSNHYAPDTTEASAVKFISTYKAKYNGEVPDAMAALGYDAFFVMMDALKRAKTLSREDIKDALTATKEVQGVTGKISFDKNRNPIKSAVVLKVENGKVKYFATVNP